MATLLLTPPRTAEPSPRERVIPGETWDDRKRLELVLAERWLHGQARAYLLDAERGLALRLERRLEAQASAPRWDRRRLAFRELKSLLGERLDPWYAELRPQADTMFRALAARLGVPQASLGSEGPPFYRLYVRSPFLDATAGIARLLDTLGPTAWVSRRVRAAAHREARLLLHANVARIVDHLQQRLEDGVHRLAAHRG